MGESRFITSGRPDYFYVLLDIIRYYLFVCFFAGTQKKYLLYHALASFIIQYRTRVLLGFVVFRETCLFINNAASPSFSRSDTSAFSVEYIDDSDPSTVVVSRVDVRRSVTRV